MLVCGKLTLWYISRRDRDPLFEQQCFSRPGNTCPHDLQQQQPHLGEPRPLVQWVRCLHCNPWWNLPLRWHVPTELDWVELESFLIGAGYGDRMGTALKSTSGWAEAGNGDDAFGFNGTGGGVIWPDGGSYNYNYIGTYWTSSTTAATPESGNYRQLANTTDQMANGPYWLVTGCSVRCVAD
jgi:uncharacterized protein (TIGR02145 family)